MSLDILPRSAAATPRPARIEGRLAPVFFLALLTGAGALASFAFACATPFAAFAVVAAAALPLRPALLVIAATWLANQAIGFGVLGYPHDANTMLWGLAIGAAALAATATAGLVLRSLPRLGRAGLGIALVGAFAADQLVLYAATSVLGGAGDFTVAIVAHLGLLSLVWLVGLVAACEVFRLLTLARRQPSF